MHTEKEMKAKVCWRTMGQPVRENCIGSECAAWIEGPDQTHVMPDGSYKEVPTGCCGLVREP